jgi:electron transfer flavoprotein alpha/beta subunit
MTVPLRVLACVKRVPAPGARIVLTADGRGIDTRNLGFTTSPHEECAVEEAIRLVEANGGGATVLTVGPAAADEQLRYAVSVGVGTAVLVTHASLDGGDGVESEWDAQATARAIADAIGGLEAADGPFDLVLFGNESADTGSHARSAGRSSTASRGSRSATDRCGRDVRAARASRCTSCRCPPCWGSRRGSTCRGTPRCRGG